MKRTFIALALGGSLAACGGEPPWQGGGGGEETPTTEIPEALRGDLESFRYNPDAPGGPTLVVRGVSLEDGPFEAAYRRRPGLDRGGYQAFTAQDGSLDRHSTAYVKDINGTRASVVVTGGQFGYYFSGTGYANSSYSAPAPTSGQNEAGLVSYIGNYVGMLNLGGDGGDLLPIAPGTDPGFVPVQSAEVTGRAMINASFTDATVNGIVSGRRIVDLPGVTVADLELAPTTIAENGSFTGETTIGQETKGSYGGIFGGNGATAVAGSLEAEKHIDGFDKIQEKGIFVLAKCGTPEADPVCDQPTP